MPETHWKLKHHLQALVTMLFVKLRLMNAFFARQHSINSIFILIFSVISSIPVIFPLSISRAIFWLGLTETRYEQFPLAKFFVGLFSFGFIYLEFVDFPSGVLKWNDFSDWETVFNSKFPFYRWHLQPSFPCLYLCALISKPKENHAWLHNT